MVKTSKRVSKCKAKIKIKLALKIKHLGWNTEKLSIATKIMQMNIYKIYPVMELQGKRLYISLSKKTMTLINGLELGSIFKMLKRNQMMSWKIVSMKMKK